MNHPNPQQDSVQGKKIVTVSKPVSIKQADSVKSILRPKLKIGQPNDKYEQEADRVAEQVMRMPEPRSTSLSGDSSQAKNSISHKESIQRVSSTCAEHKELIRAKINRNVNPEVTPVTSSSIQSLQGGGQPLSGYERTFFEPRFGADFSNVRVHNNTRAASVARSVNARAFTHGHNIVFGEREYSSDTPSGRKLLAHELTHVVQQNSTTNFIGENAKHASYQKSSKPRVGKGVSMVSTKGVPSVQAMPAINIGKIIYEVISILTAKSFIENPGLEKNTIVKDALQLLHSRYSKHVKPKDIEFRIMGKKKSHIKAFGSFGHVGGRSFWDEKKPVIELPQQKFKTIAEYLNKAKAGTATSLDIINVLAVIQTIGHEMRHLFLAKEKHPNNPMMKPFEKQSQAAFKQVRKNWLKEINAKDDSARKKIRKELGIKNMTKTYSINTLPQSALDQIDKGTQEVVVDDLYIKSAYMVEETMVTVEEYAFAKNQQKSTNKNVREHGEIEQRILGKKIYRLHNQMNSMAQANKSGAPTDPFAKNIWTPERFEKAQEQLLKWVEKQYGKKSDEMIFYKNSIKGIGLYVPSMTLKQFQGRRP